MLCSDPEMKNSPISLLSCYIFIFQTFFSHIQSIIMIILRSNSNTVRRSFVFIIILNCNDIGSAHLI